MAWVIIRLGGKIGGSWFITEVWVGYGDSIERALGDDKRNAMMNV
jgi:hypothetical protein